MTKDIYFSHDANAIDDPKCMMLVSQLGMEGYGIFWALVERLRLQDGYKLPIALLPALAKKFDTSSAKVEAVVRSYGLFVVDNENFFFSESLNRRMALMSEKIERRKIASAKANSVRWGKIALPESSERTPNGLRTDSDFIQNRNRNIKKEKSIKEKSPKTTFVVPSPQEIEEYIQSKNMAVDAATFFSYYESVGWKVGSKPMKNWKMALATWERRERKENHGQQNVSEKQSSVYDGCLQ